MPDTDPDRGPGTRGNRVIPTIPYRDARAAIEWLGKAFGLEPRLVVPDGDAVVHAQLVAGDAMIMLSTARDGGFGALQQPPAAGGPGTQSPYVVVDDPDAHHARAVAAGAEIVMPLVDQDYGGRGYTCRDCEGHVWSFGSYDPWAEEA